MKIYLDDERTPFSLERVYWSNEAIELLKEYGVKEISSINREYSRRNG